MHSISEPISEVGIYNDMYTVRYAASFAYRGNTLGRGRDGEIRQDIISQGVSTGYRRQ